LTQHEVDHAPVSVELRLGGRVDPWTHLEVINVIAFARDVDVDEWNGLTEIQWREADKSRRVSQKERAT
jgi:hypothetical protein